MVVRSARIAGFRGNSIPLPSKIYTERDLYIHEKRPLENAYSLSLCRDWRRV